MPDFLQNLGPMFSNVLLPMLEKSNIQLPNGSVQYGVNSLAGQQNVTDNYTNYLNQSAKDSAMTPIAQSLEGMAQNLALEINTKLFKLSPEKASSAVTGFTGGRLLADFILKQTGSANMVQGFDSFLSKHIISPELGGASAVEKNKQASAIAQAVFQATSNPAMARTWEGLSPQDAAGLMLRMYEKGNFDHIWKSPNMWDQNTGTLTSQGTQALFTAGRQVSGVARNMSDLLGVAPAEAMQQAETMFGGDPVKAFGSKGLQDLSRELIGASKAVGLQQDETRNLIANLAGVYQQTGRNPIQSLNVAKQALSTLYAAKGVMPEKANTGKFNQALLTNLTDAMNNKHGKLASAGYAALLAHRGKNVADETMRKLLLNPANLGDVSSLKKAVNQYLTGDEQLNEENVSFYADSDQARDFLNSGKALQGSLYRRAAEMEDVGLKMLSHAGINKADLDRVQRSGRMDLFSDKLVTSLVNNSGGLSTKMDRMKRERELQRSLNSAARAYGFERFQDAGSFVQAVRNKDKHREMQTLMDRNKRIHDTLKDKGVVSGAMGAVANKDKGFKGMWEGYTGNTNISQQDVSNMHAGRVPTETAPRLPLHGPKGL